MTIAGADRAAVTDFERLMTSRWVHLLSLVVLCAAYIQGAFDKLIDLPGAAAEVASLHLHPAALFLPPVILTEVVGSILIVTGCFRWLGALWLAGFTLIANLLANRFWSLSGPARTPNENAFFEHWSLIGGLLLVAWIDIHRRRGRILGIDPKRPG